MTLLSRRPALVSRRSALALGGSALLLPSSLRAQAAWPTGPVTFVVGYAAGGSTDINARELAQVMTPVIGQTIVIDNKGGAAGSIGLRAAAAAKPDGQTLFVAVGTNVIINPHVQKGMIDTISSLAPVCQITDYQYVLVVGNSVPAKNAQELVALAKKDPEKLTYSSSGVGGNNHLAGALFADAAGIKMTHVPYKGTGPALIDIAAGHVDLIFMQLEAAMKLHEGGKRILPFFLRRTIVQRKLIEAACSYASSELRTAALDPEHPLRRGAKEAVRRFAERLAAAQASATAARLPDHIEHLRGSIGVDPMLVAG